jgi:DNA polymerase
VAAAVTDALIANPALEELRESISGCTRCPLSETRTQTVFGSGSTTADLMFVGEAPGFHEDKQGVPFVGSAGQLLGKLLAGIGMTREDVFVANVLKCRPPGNRDPQPEEIAACESHLFRQIELIQPKVICTLGNFATKLLSGKPDGITKVHGREQQVVLGGTRVLLFPIFHPAAALYTPRMLDVLAEDFSRLPALLGRDPVAPAPAADAGPAAQEPAARESAPQEPALQLGLF